MEVKRLEIEMNSYDLRVQLIGIFALKGWKTWIEERIDEDGSYRDSKKYIVCCEVPDEAVKESVCRVNAASREHGSSHTPGPWRKGNAHNSVVTDNTTSCSERWLSENDTCLLRKMHEHCVKAYGGNLIAESIPDENIDLISSAPDLLEALEMAVEWLTDTPEGRTIPQVNGQPAEWMRKAQEAIAKAKGESRP